MPREPKVVLEKVTLNLVAGDRDILAAFNPASGWSVAARNLIHRHCELLREKDSQEIVSDVSKLTVKMPSMKNLTEA